MSSLSTRILLGRTARAAPGAGGAPAPSPLRPARPPTRGTLVPPSDSRAKAEAGQNQPSPGASGTQRQAEPSVGPPGGSGRPREQRMGPGPCCELAQAMSPAPPRPRLLFQKTPLQQVPKGRMKTNPAKPSHKAPGGQLAPACAGPTAAESQQPRPASPVHVVVAVQVQDPGGQLAGHALQGEGVRRQGLRHPAASQIALEVSLPGGAAASPASGEQGPCESAPQLLPPHRGPANSPGSHHRVRPPAASPQWDHPTDRGRFLCGPHRPRPGCRPPGPRACPLTALKHQTGPVTPSQEGAQGR